MTTRPTTTRLLVHAAVLLIGSAALSGCAPQVTPTPTPTPVFASEDEAFAAAEEVYREYVDAADSSSSETSDLLVGEALEEYLDGLSYLKSNGLSLTGHTEVLSFTGESTAGTGASFRVTATACSDLLSSRVVNEDGDDVTPEDRGRFWRISLTFVSDGGDLLISDYTGEEVPRC